MICTEHLGADRQGLPPSVERVRFSATAFPRIVEQTQS